MTEKNEMLALAERFEKAPAWADDEDDNIASFIAVDMSPAERDKIVALLRAAAASAEPVAWQWRYVGKDEPWATPSGGAKLTAEELKREQPIEQRPLYTHPAPDAAPIDPTNHHNALRCPYCNPKGLKFTAPDAEIVAALEAGRRYAVGYYNAALMSYDSAKAFEHETELKKIDAALAKAKGGSHS